MQIYNFFLTYNTFYNFFLTFYTMEIFEELNAAYNELRQAGVVRTKKELAERLDISDKGLIMAMKGDPRYATASLRTKVLRFRDEHLGEKQPEPVDPMLARVDAAHQIAMKAQEQTDRLLTMLEFQMGMAETTPVRIGKKGDRLTDKQ